MGVSQTGSGAGGFVEVGNEFGARVLEDVDDRALPLFNVNAGLLGSGDGGILLVVGSGGVGDDELPKLLNVKAGAGRIARMAIQGGVWSGGERVAEVGFGETAK